MQIAVPYWSLNRALEAGRSAGGLKRVTLFDYVQNSARHTGDGFPSLSPDSKGLKRFRLLHWGRGQTFLFLSGMIFIPPDIAAVSCTGMWTFSGTGPVLATTTQSPTLRNKRGVGRQTQAAKQAIIWLIVWAFVLVPYRARSVALRSSLKAAGSGPNSSIAQRSLAWSNY